MAIGMKYIVIDDGFGEEIYIFSETVPHDHFWERIRGQETKLVSAGFVNEFHDCYGESTSLGRPSRRKEDTALIKKHYPFMD